MQRIFRRTFWWLHLLEPPPSIGHDRSSSISVSSMEVGPGRFRFTFCTYTVYYSFPFSPCHRHHSHYCAAPNRSWSQRSERRDNHRTWHFGCRCTFLVATTSSRRWNCHNKPFPESCSVGCQVLGVVLFSLFAQGTGNSVLFYAQWCKRRDYEEHF